MTYSDLRNHDILLARNALALVNMQIFGQVDISDGVCLDHVLLRLACAARKHMSRSQPLTVCFVSWQPCADFRGIYSRLAVPNCLFLSSALFAFVSQPPPFTP